MNRSLIVLLFIMIQFVAQAQPPHFRPEQMDDDEILGMQVRDIVSWLELEGRTKDRFVKEYIAFRKEIDEIKKTVVPPSDEMSEAEIDASIQTNFEVGGKILAIRKEYYQRFKKFLKPSQIQLIYRVENEAGRRMREDPGPGPRGSYPMPPRPDINEPGFGPGPHHAFTD